MESSKDRVLDPVSRTSEILFGLIMVLSFTCSLSVANIGREDVREMLIGALGCNLAWGIIDAFFYLMSVAVERGRERFLLMQLRSNTDQAVARGLLEDILPEFLIGSFSPTAFEDVKRHLLRAAQQSQGALLRWQDFRAAWKVFTLVFLSTFPVAVPFIILNEAELALRVSNAIALLLLFALGFSVGRYAGRRAWAWGLGTTVIGAALVSVTIALGG